MGNSHANSQKENSKETTSTYTQVTIKDLNNLIYKKKLKLEEEQNKLTQEKNLKQEKIMQKIKEYLYTLDVGKLLVDAANNGENTARIIKEGYYFLNNDKKQSKNSNNKYFHSYSYYDERKTSIEFEITKDILKEFLEDYQKFVTDVLKLNIIIDIDTENNSDSNSYTHDPKRVYKATWE